jgi:hypothetical protein
MQNCNSIRCDLDLASYEMAIGAPLVFGHTSASITVRLLNLWSGFEHVPETSTIQIHLKNDLDCFIQVEDISISIFCNQRVSWSSFLECNIRQLIELLMTRILFRGEDDILWIEPSGADEVWILYLNQIGRRVWKSQLARLLRPGYIDTSFTLMNTGEQRENLTAVFEDFKNWLPKDFLRASEDHGNDKLLSVKVHPDQLWFLRFPVSAFCQLKYEGLAAYSDVEWIVTHKGFLQTSRERIQMREDLSDPANFLKYGVIVVNTYREHSENKICSEGTELVIDICSILQDIDFDIENISLRWYLNPSALQINQILLDKETLYFFADFEASSGEWETGHGQYSAWNSSHKAQPSVFPAQEIRQESIPQYSNRSLSHIRLMRVFHCNSIFDPHRAFLDRRQPADNNSIVRRLLDAGAERVEGGLTMENYCDYLCSLIDLLCRSNQFKFILSMKCLELGVDLSRLYTRINNFLNVCQRESITV